MSDKKLFPGGLAERLKSRAGKPFRPSNGTEGELFCGIWCEQCTRDGNCEITLKTLFHDVDDPDYPKQWIYGEDGQPKCTAFEQKGTPNDRT